MTASAIITKAAEFLGITGSPKGSHNVPFNTAYYGYPVNDTGAYYWCVVFVWYVFKAVGASALLCNGAKVNRCKTVRDWAIGAGLTVEKAAIRPGDLVLFDWEPNNSPDHIGIATSTVTGGKFKTIEGNVDDAVKEMTRDLNKVALVVRPQYQTGSACNPEACPIMQNLKSLLNKEA